MKSPPGPRVKPGDRASANPGVKRLFASLIIVFVVITAAALLINLAGRARLKQAMIDGNSALIGAILKKYPQAEQEIISLIKAPEQDDARRGVELLRKYGIRADETLSNSPSMAKYFYYNLAAVVIPLVFLAGISLILLERYFRAHYSQIRDLTGYAGLISGGEYSLDIRDNEEGDLSILKNEIYKITTTLREQATQLQGEKALLADALADISHQLKTPLTSLLVLNNLLIETPREADRIIFLDKMSSQLARIEWLITSLLKISKLDAGAITLKSEKIMAGDLVKKALESLAIPLEIRALQVRIAGNQDSAFSGDFNWCGEALINILKNCIEHTPEQGRLDIFLDENPIYTEIRVADSGAGIATADLPHIFDRFYKGQNASGNQVGIGLAMARAIIEGQGGGITVKSAREEGTEFSVKFYKTAKTGPK